MICAVAYVMHVMCGWCLPLLLQCCTVEHSIYTRKDKAGTAIIAIHIDDMPITASLPTAMTNTKESLHKYFEIVDLGPVKWLLDICVERNRRTCTITLSQTAYINT